MSEINNERNSAGTAQKGVDESVKEEIKSGCPDATCSASDLLERRYQWVVDRWENGFSDDEQRDRNELINALRS